MNSQIYSNTTKTFILDNNDASVGINDKRLTKNTEQSLELTKSGIHICKTL